MVLDEGGVVISDGLAPLTRMPIALVGTAEKVRGCLHLTSYIHLATDAQVPAPFALDEETAC
jgi:hypothetical protein